MQDILKALAPHIFEILSPILLAGISWLSVKISKYIQAKTNNALLEGILTRLSDAVFTAVAQCEQTIVTELKKARADGVVTAQEYMHIKNMALNSAKQYLGEKGLSELKKILGLDDGGITKLIADKIEAAVLSMKAPGGARANP